MMLKELLSLQTKYLTLPIWYLQVLINEEIVPIISIFCSCVTLYQLYLKTHARFSGTLTLSCNHGQYKHLSY